MKAPPRVFNSRRRPWRWPVIDLRWKMTIHLPNGGMSSFYCLAFKCVNRTAGSPCSGEPCSSHAVCLPLQGPQYEQHQSAAPESPPQPPLSRRAVSTAGCCRAASSQCRTHSGICLPYSLWEPDETSWGSCQHQQVRHKRKHLGGGAGGRTAVILEIKL